MWDERQFAVKDNAQELSFLYSLQQELGYRLAARWVLGGVCAIYGKCMHTVLEGENLNPLV